MSETVSKIPVWYWVVVGGAVLWNAFGVTVFIFTVTMSPETLSTMSAAEQALMESMPVWATLAFAFAVFDGLAASILLLIRHRLALLLFAISFAATIVNYVHWLLISDAPAVYGAEAYQMPATVTAIGAFLIWFSWMANNRGWLK